MDIEKLPSLGNIATGDINDPHRPILSFNLKAEGPHRAGEHKHPRAQIIYQCSGVYRVATEEGNFVVPPRQAIWIPPMLYHTTFTNAPTHALMFFVDFSLAHTLPDKCMVVEVSPLLEQLFLRAVAYGNDYRGNDKTARLVEVLLDELHSLRPAPLRLPLAKDKRLYRAMEIMLRQPGEDCGIDELAKHCGASSRTLARLFRQEAGMTCLEWRNRLRLMEAIDRLGRGYSVNRVAGDLGYASVSAFIAMFRRNLGATPSQYMAQGFVAA